MPTRSDWKRRVFGELRPSQIITTFGPGAVVDLRNMSVVIAGIDQWKRSPEQELDEPRLKSLLRVSKLYRPPVDSDQGAASVPSYLFPRYLTCPKCNRLGRFDQPGLFYFDGQRFRCTNHKGDRKSGPRAFPARFVMACAEGHIDDFPWNDYVHKWSPNACKPENLTFHEATKSASVADLIIHCENKNCRASRSMQAAFDRTKGAPVGACSGARPWLGEGSSEQCAGGSPRTALRGASNLYFSEVQSALAIPEWDDPVHAAIAQVEDQLSKIDSEDKLKALLALVHLPSLARFEPSHLFKALMKRREQSGVRLTPMEIRHQEFRALNGPLDHSKAADREFLTEHVDVPTPFRDRIKRVVIVRRLREVRALRGFTRIDKRFDPLLDDDEEPEQFRMQKLGVDSESWRPAVELRGEGVFIELDEAAVGTWEITKATKARSKVLEDLHNNWRREHKLPVAAYPGARFVLLHSLAHLLIQGMALDSGYSAASIRERIYSSAQTANRMAGLLLYTATPDSDGSLGGLADKGRPGRLGPLLSDALARANFCSSDPLCGHSSPGELGQLNGAACHACLLVSETACERSNRYLDRAHVVDTISQLGTHFF